MSVPPDNNRFVPSTEWQDMPDTDKVALPNGAITQTDFQTGKRRVRWDAPVPLESEVVYKKGKTAEARPCQDDHERASAEGQNGFAGVDEDMVDTQEGSKEESGTESENDDEFEYTPTGNTPTGYIERGICRDDYLVGEGFIERGCAGLDGGPSGVGKSSIEMQKGCCWSCGKPAFEFYPMRPLRVLMIQNEDSENDLAQQSEVARALGLDLNLIRKNFWIETVRGKTGWAAICIMDYLIKWWKADLMLLNPLSAYHDGDISKNADNVKFLYGQLGGLIQERKVGLQAAHHKGKPPKGQQKKHEDAYHEVMYDILGGSILTNFFRGIVTINPIANSDVYKFIVAKRFEQSGWPLKALLFKWHEDRAKRLWVPASTAEGQAAEKDSGKTIEELRKLVPALGAIPKPALELDAMKNGFTRREFEGILEQSLDDGTPDKDRLHEWSIYNPHGLAKKSISRFPQPEGESHQEVRVHLEQQRRVQKSSPQKKTRRTSAKT